MESSVVFKPETDEAALDDEVSKTNEAFQDAGNVELEVDKSDLENLGPDGPLEVGVEAEGSGVGGGVGGPGAGAQAGAAGLASKIPKTVSGSLAAAALPVALAGGIGVGLLSQMSASSARLQTTARILGIARDNFFRAPGDVLDENVTRPIADEILGLSTEFSQNFRNEGAAFAIGGLSSGVAGELADAIWGRATSFNLAGTLGLGRLETTFGAMGDFFAGAGSQFQSVSKGFERMETATGNVKTAMNELPGDIRNRILSFQPPSATDILSKFSFPSSTMLLGQFGAPSASALVDATFGGVRIGGRDVVDEVFGGISIAASDLIDEVTGGGGGGGGGGYSGPGSGFIDFVRGNDASAATGGRVTRSGLAEIHKGETIADPDRLVSDLADAIGTAPGGGGGADMGAVESKLDTLHRDISRLASAMEQVELTVEGERFGELSKRTQASSRSNNLLTQ